VLVAVPAYSGPYLPSLHDALPIWGRLGGPESGSGMLRPAAGGGCDLDLVAAASLGGVPMGSAVPCGGRGSDAARAGAAADCPATLDGVLRHAGRSADGIRAELVVPAGRRRSVSWCAPVPESRAERSDAYRRGRCGAVAGWAGAAGARVADCCCALVGTVSCLRTFLGGPGGPGRAALPG